MNVIKRPAALLITLLIVGSTAPAYAQQPALVRASGGFAPQSTVSADELSDPLPGRETQLSNFSASVNVPIRLSDNALLMPGAAYDLLYVEQTPAAQLGVPETTDLHSTTLSLLFSYQITPGWAIAAQVSAALSGDFARVDDDHLRMGGLLLATYAFSDRFKLGGGLLVGWQFGELLPLPSILVEWQIVDELRLQAFLPRSTALIWRVHDRVELGVSGSFRGQSFSMTSDRVQGRWPCSAETFDNPVTTTFNETQADRDRCFSNLAFSHGEVGPTVGVRLASRLWLTFRGAYAFFRRYEFMNDDNETPDIGALELAPAFTVHALVEFRFPQKQPEQEPSTVPAELEVEPD